MRLTDKTARWSANKRYVGKYKKFNCDIYYSADKGLSCEHKPNPYWYYCCTDQETGVSHNSLWDNQKYTSKEECHDACVAYIDKIIKEKTNE